METHSTLPVFEIRGPLAIAARKARARVLLKAPTGSGKSTIVPGILCDAGVEGQILVVEPRRMAARLLAGWVARQRGGMTGGEVGYAVRFDSSHGPDTRVLYLTDGVFQRMLQSNPNLTGVATVIFDEFHERRLAVDVALGRCLDLQEGARPDLAVVVMSATLETGNLASFLAATTSGEVAEVASLEVSGRSYPVEIAYRPPRKVRDRSGRMTDPPVWEQVTAACREALASPECGDVLCFLPGMHEIRKTEALLRAASWARGWEIHPLHGSLPAAAQEAAVLPGAQPKIIIATNVAETSLTIGGVRTVIDGGTARVAGHDPRRGIGTLLIEKISRASAEQRAGRAGRVAPGRCFRLWSEADQARRAEFTPPEVRRVDLSETVLLLKAAGVEEVREFRWLDPPEPAALAAAESLLHELSATDRQGRITKAGRQMSDLPLEPRLARLLLAGAEHGCVAEMAFVCASLQGEGVWSGSGGLGHFTEETDFTDFQAEWRGLEAAEGMQFDPRRVRELGVHGRGAREIMRQFERLGAMAIRKGWNLAEVNFALRREAVGKAMLAGFSDRLGVRASMATLACRMVGKRRAKLDADSMARQGAALVACEMTEVEGREVETKLRRATVVELPWLKELFPDDWGEFRGVAWDETRRRVVTRRERRFRDLVLESKDDDRVPDIHAAAALLAQHVLSDGLVLKNWDAKVEQWCRRLACLSEWMPELELPGWTSEDHALAVAEICHGALGYKEIKNAEVWPVLRAWLNPMQQSALDSYAPERLRLTNGREAKLVYELGQEPRIGLRVRDLFGVWETPRIADGRVPVLVQVQAPNQRPWQMTTDLKSFWTNGYPQMRRELAGRYPKHPWPENPRENPPSADTT